VVHNLSRYPAGTIVTESVVAVVELPLIPGVQAPVQNLEFAPVMETGQAVQADDESFSDSDVRDPGTLCVVIVSKGLTWVYLIPIPVNFFISSILKNISGLIINSFSRQRKKLF
jgi:hypothetical protein